MTLFIDHISKRMFVEFQHSTNAEETLTSKIHMEREAYKERIKIKSFHADNGVFKADKFQKHININHQSITFCGVGAHHQNGVAEHSIKDLTSTARTLILHAK